MPLNPLVFLLGGLALLVSTLTIAVLNRRAFRTENPYDTPDESRDLAYSLAAIRHGDALYRAGLDVGREFPHPSPERLAASLSRAGLGKFEVHRSATRVEIHVRDGPHRGAPAVGEPLCYFTLGVLRGALPPARGMVRPVEDTCHGTGASHCVFSTEVKAPVVR